MKNVSEFSALLSGEDKDRIVNEWNCGVEMLDLFEKFFQSPRIIQNLYDMVNAMSDVYSQYYQEKSRIDGSES